MAPFRLEWEAPEFAYREKDVSWYWASIILAVLILAAALWQRNFLFGFFVVVAEILILVWANQQPRTVRFLCTEKGLTVDGKKIYALTDIEAFGAKEHEGREWSRIVLYFHRRFAGTLVVLIPTARMHEIKSAIQKAGVAETDRDESFIDILAQFLGF